MEVFNILELPEHLLGKIVKATIECEEPDEPWYGALFSVARANERLYMAVCTVLDSIYCRVGNQGKLSTIMLYLQKQLQAQNVRSLRLSGPYTGNLELRQLPEALSRLTSLKVDHMAVQLQPQAGNAFQGLLPQLKALKKLRLIDVRVLDAQVVLSGDVQLDALRIGPLHSHPMPPLPVQQLSLQSQLTCLQLYMAPLMQQVSWEFPASLVFDRLVELRLQGYSMPAGVLASMPLQQLSLQDCSLAEGVLAEILQKQQLRILGMSQCQWEGGVTPSVDKFAPFASSSVLKLVDIKDVPFPVGVFGALFPVTVQLPRLTHLYWTVPQGEPASACSSVAHCCPSIQSLEIHMPYVSGWGQLLAQLGQLTGLSRLWLSVRQLQPADIEQLGRLSGLSFLLLQGSEQPQSQLPLWQLSSLRQLKHLYYNPTGEMNQHLHDMDGIPVWRKVMDRWHRRGPMRQAAVNAKVTMKGQR